MVNRSKRGAVVVAACVALAAAAAGLSLPRLWPDHSAHGPGGVQALTVYGPPANGVIGYNHVEVGKTYRFSFPVPRNRLTQPVRLTGASIQTVPAGAVVMGYELYSLKEVGDYILSYDATDPSNIGDLPHKKNYINSGVTIAPRSDSDYWAMVAVKVTGTVKGNLSGCVYRFAVGSKHYHQEFPCEFQLGDDG